MKITVLNYIYMIVHVTILTVNYRSCNVESLSCQLLGGERGTRGVGGRGEGGGGDTVLQL